MNRIYKFIVIFLILGVIAWIIYFFVSKTTPLEPMAQPVEQIEISPKGQNEQPTQELATSTQKEEVVGDEYDYGAEIVKTSFKELKKVSGSPAIGYWYYADNNRIFYITENGEFKKIIDDKDESVSINPILGVSMVRPNRDGSQVLIKFTDTQGSVWGMFSSMDEKIAPLNRNIGDAVWDPFSKDIIATINKNNKTDIIQLAEQKQYTDGTFLVGGIKMLDTFIIKQSPDEILFVEKSGNDYATSIWQYNTKTKLFSILKKGLFDFSVNQTNSVIFSFSKNNGFFVGNNVSELLFPPIQQTLPEKCSSLADTGICFVPTKPVSLFDWTTNSTKTLDSIVVYDLLNKTEDQFDLTSISNTIIDAKNVTVSNTATYLINKYDNYIYALR